MYATVIQSLTAEGATRQTAVVVTDEQGIITYSRIAGGRGRAGAWGIGYPEDLAINGTDEQVLGMPSSVRVTASDEDAIGDGTGKPTVLWQKLARVAGSEDFPTVKTLNEVYANVLREAESDPRLLATYLGGSSDAPKHIVDALRAPEVAPEPEAVDFTSDASLPVEEFELDADDTDEDDLPLWGNDDELEFEDEDSTPAVLAPEQVMSTATAAQDSAEQAFMEAFEHGDEKTMLAAVDAYHDAEEKFVGAFIEKTNEQDPTFLDRVAEHVAAEPVNTFVTPETHTTDEAEAPKMVPTVVGAGGHVPQQSELAPLIVPSLKDVESYVERTLPGDKTETEVFDFARKHGHAVAIFGHSGTGKTSSARNYAAQRQLPFVPFECNPQTDEEVVQGTYIPTGNGTELAWRYSQLATAIQQPSVILLNESNRMSAKANALFLHLLQERELIVSRHKNEVIPVHPDVLFITDANPGYQGTTKHDQAFLDRFAITLEYEYDREVEKHFIPSTSLLDLAVQLREQAEREDRYRDTPVSTRLLINFVQHAKGLGMEFAIASFLASFAADERDALRMVVEVYSTRIAEELNLADSEDASDEESFSFDKEDELTF